MSEAQPPKETPKQSKRAKWRRLDDIQTVRLALAAVIKKVYDGDLAPERGAVCVSGLRTLANVIYGPEQEKRLRAIEDRLRESTQ
jgi:hypothetical protein